MEIRSWESFASYAVNSLLTSTRVTNTSSGICRSPLLPVWPVERATRWPPIEKQVAGH